MAIPLAQLETWSHQGAITTAKLTHESIRSALSADTSPLKDRITNKSVVIYLQGSYVNDTNIRGDSDVDVIVELTSTFSHDPTSLYETEKIAHQNAYPNATYLWSHFRNDVITALEKYYTKNLVNTNGNKSIKLLPASGRLIADVVPVITHRKYIYFTDKDDYTSENGVKFYHKTTGKEIINFPKHHYDNGVAKHSEKTPKMFKPVVRVFKNLRSFLIEKKLIDKDLAPSYFLQSLIYNVPDENFVNSLDTSVYNVLKHLYQNPIDAFVCQNEQHNLFGDTQEQWNLTNASNFIKEAVKLWDNWGKL